MSERQAAMDDWVVPAVLIGLSLGLLLVVGSAFAVSAEQQSEAPALVQELDVYTACLVGQGADVPRVEVGRDGEFAIVVPGSLVEGQVDEAAWSKAADACASMAPDLFGAFLGGIPFDGFAALSETRTGIANPFNESMEAEAFPSGVDGHLWDTDHPRLGRAIRPPGELPRRSEQLRDAAGERSGPRIYRLRRHCEQFDR